MKAGPLQLLVIGFMAPKIDGHILSSLGDVSDAGLIRVVDSLGVSRDESGDVAAAEMSELTEDVAVTYGAWVGTVSWSSTWRECGSFGVIAASLLFIFFWPHPTVGMVFATVIGLIIHLVAVEPLRTQTREATGAGRSPSCGGFTRRAERGSSQSKRGGPRHSLVARRHFQLPVDALHV